MPSAQLLYSAQEFSGKVVYLVGCRARMGLSDPNRPIASFMFLGPTGVGVISLLPLVCHVQSKSNSWTVKTHTEAVLGEAWPCPKIIFIAIINAYNMLRISFDN